MKMVKPYIVLIHDYDEDVMLLADAFAELNHNCDFFNFENQKELYKFINKKSYPPIAILIDFYLSGFSGVEVCKELGNNRLFVNSKNVYL